MCGIFCIFSTTERPDILLKYLKLCEDCIKRRGPDYNSYQETEIVNHKFITCASVLWLQGEKLVKQPISNDSSIFLYNGDIFGGDISDDDRNLYGDTITLLRKLENSDNIVELLSNIQGPYAFIYLDKKNLKLYFGRDVFGRRSLLIGLIEGGLILTSVATNDLNCLELPAIGTFSYDLHLKTLTLIPWSITNNDFSLKLKELEAALHCEIELDQKLKKIHCKTFVEPTQVDLQIFQRIKLMPVNNALEILLNDTTFLNNVEILHKLLDNAIMQRIYTQPKYCKNCIHNKEFCNHAVTGVLFSGGLDCTILALLSDKFTDQGRSIDLINVAFECNAGYNTPDRKTGLESFEELKKLCPNRSWNFVAVNVPRSEVNEDRKNHIRHLIHPMKSVLDDSLGCALWYAGRGRCESYETPSRVLLVGMGADELFGGYTRHRAALKKGGWLSLHEALTEDWQNISHRNLARDDRVVSDHGRQLRTPYLDENVVEFVRNLDCWRRCCPSEELPVGLGDKILLRALAYYLGIRSASTFKKRAFQFGSRIANSKENAHDVSPRL